MTALKILFVCNKSPWPPLEGGSIAMNRLIEGLCDAGHTVKVLAADSEKYHVDPEKIPASYRRKTDIEFVRLDLAVKPLPAFFNLFTGRSYHVQRFISKDFEKKLSGILQKHSFDIVQLETLFMAPYVDVIRRYSRAKVLLRAHNIEHLIWKRMAAESTNFFKRRYLQHLASTLENYEKTVLNRFDAILPITDKDASFFKKHTRKPVETVPFGINPETETGKDNQQPENALFYIGAMNWLPNEEGIRWFLDKVWPSLSNRYPGLKFYIAGRMMPRWLTDLKIKNVEVVGEVPDAKTFIRSKSILAAPLFSGSGVRVKIIESMSLAKAVVATRTGAEGIEYTDGKDIIIAETPEAFTRAVGRLFENPEEAARLGENARNLIRTKHNNQKIIDRLQAFYQELL